MPTFPVSAHVEPTSPSAARVRSERDVGGRGEPRSPDAAQGGRRQGTRRRSPSARFARAVKERELRGAQPEGENSQAVVADKAQAEVVKGEATRYRGRGGGGVDVNIHVNIRVNTHVDFHAIGHVGVIVDFRVGGLVVWRDIIRRRARRWLRRLLRHRTKARRRQGATREEPRGAPSRAARIDPNALTGAGSPTRFRPARNRARLGFPRQAVALLQLHVPARRGSHQPGALLRQLAGIERAGPDRGCSPIPTAVDCAVFVDPDSDPTRPHDGESEYEDARVRRWTTTTSRPTSSDVGDEVPLPRAA